MGKTKIEWATDTWNPVTGCTKVSPGCDHCYALTISRRMATMGHPKYQGVVSGKDWTGEVHCHPEALGEPLSWKQPSRRIFVCSMSDLFHSKVPWEFIDRVFQVMAACPQHTFLVLTKRPGRMAWFAENVCWPSNVWAGTSVESQKFAPRLDCLARVPAKVRFISAEPLLGPLDLEPYFFKCSGTCAPTEDNPICDCKGLAISWVITGGESGPGAKPAHPDWFRSVRDQCLAAGVPYFHKQNGEWCSGLGTQGGFVVLQNSWSPGNPYGRSVATPTKSIHNWYDGYLSVRVGKKAAGALLDGREWREFPNGRI